MSWIGWIRLRAHATSGFAERSRGQSTDLTSYLNVRRGVARFRSGVPVRCLYSSANHNKRWDFGRVQSFSTQDQEKNKVDNTAIVTDATDVAFQYARQEPLSDWLRNYFDLVEPAMKLPYKNGSRKCGFPVDPDCEDLCMGDYMLRKEISSKDQGPLMSFIIPFIMHEIYTTKFQLRPFWNANSKMMKEEWKELERLKAESDRKLKESRMILRQIEKDILNASKTSKLAKVLEPRESRLNDLCTLHMRELAYKRRVMISKGLKNEVFYIDLLIQVFKKYPLMLDSMKRSMYLSGSLQYDSWPPAERASKDIEVRAQECVKYIVPFGSRRFNFNLFRTTLLYYTRWAAHKSLLRFLQVDPSFTLLPLHQVASEAAIALFESETLQNPEGLRKLVTSELYKEMGESEEYSLFLSKFGSSSHQRSFQPASLLDIQSESLEVLGVRCCNFLVDASNNDANTAHTNFLLVGRVTKRYISAFGEEMAETKMPLNLRLTLETQIPDSKQESWDWKVSGMKWFPRAGYTNSGL